MLRLISMPDWSVNSGDFNEIILSNLHGDIFCAFTAADIALPIAIVVGVASIEQVLKPAY